MFTCGIYTLLVYLETCCPSRYFALCLLAFSNGQQFGQSTSAPGSQIFFFSNINYFNTRGHSQFSTKNISNLSLKCKITRFCSNESLLSLRFGNRRKISRSLFQFTSYLSLDRQQAQKFLEIRINTMSGYTIFKIVEHTWRLEVACSIRGSV